MQTNLTFVILKRTRACVAVLGLQTVNDSLRDSIPSFTFLCLKLHSLVTILVVFQSTSFKQFTLCRANPPSSYPIRSFAAATLPFSISPRFSNSTVILPFSILTISTFLQHTVFFYICMESCIPRPFASHRVAVVILSSVL